MPFLIPVSVVPRWVCVNNFILFIDEAYFGFGAPTCISMVEKYKNVYVARSFSKWFGLPSIRLGCIISNPTNILELESEVKNEPEGINTCTL